jgi:hypothetical protein
MKRRPSRLYSHSACARILIRIGDVTMAAAMHCPLALLVEGDAAFVARGAAYDSPARDMMAAGEPLAPGETDRSALGQHRDRVPIGPGLFRDGPAMAGIG